MHPKGCQHQKIYSSGKKNIFDTVACVVTKMMEAMIEAQILAGHLNCKYEVHAPCLNWFSSWELEVNC